MAGISDMTLSAPWSWNARVSPAILSKMTHPGTECAGHYTADGR